MTKSLLFLFAVVTAYSAAADKTCSPLEVSWVLDVSGTISAKDFSQTQEFVKTVMSKIGLGYGNKVAVTIFGTNGHQKIKCQDFTKIPDFLKAVDDLPRLPEEYTNTRDGLEKGQELLEKYGCGEREEAKKVIILLTDGLANEGVGREEGLIKSAKNIQNVKGTTVIVVAVGDFSDHQLKKMVPKHNINTLKAGFIDLNSDEFIGNVKKSVCNVVKPPTPTKGNGNWGEWKLVGECSKPCKGGKQKRTRSCDNPKPKHGGKDCDGSSTDEVDCNSDISCPHNGKWTPWSSYGACSVTCGEGTQMRTRECKGQKHGGNDCDGEAKETRKCNGNKKHCSVHGYYGEWSSFSECSVTCGKGTKMRTRTCYQPKHGGKACVGDDNQTIVCDNGISSCPHHGEWTNWSSYGACSVTCGEGTQMRTRECEGQKHGGKDCVGSKTQSQKCKRGECSVIPACTCDYKLERFTCLKWGKDEIERNFEGKCFVDKAKLAVEAVKKLAHELRADMAETRKCRLELRKQLAYGSTEIFNAYDHCVSLGSCKFIRLQAQLDDKVWELQRLIKKEEEGFGSLSPLKLLGW